MPSDLSPGQFYRQVSLDDGRAVTLKVPEWRHLDDCMGFINELVEEKADILRSKKVTREEEAEWLGGRLIELEKGELLWLIAEVDGSMLGSCDVRRRVFFEQDHVGILGIAIMKKGRGVGLGTLLITSLIDLSKHAGIKVLILDHLETNKIARSLYEKVGFIEVGRVPKAIHKDEKYIDLVRMALEI